MIFKMFNSISFFKFDDYTHTNFYIHYTSQNIRVECKEHLCFSLTFTNGKHILMEKTLVKKKALVYKNLPDSNTLLLIHHMPQFSMQQYLTLSCLIHVSHHTT